MKVVDEKTLAVEVKTYRRAAYIGFYTPKDAEPYMQILEETALIEPIEGISVNPDTKTTVIPYSPDLVIPLVNPLTGEELNRSITADEIMAIMYSLFIYSRSEVDEIAVVG
jgi:hypothetical protein